MRVAALDLGSNSFHLLVADVRPGGTFEPVAREKEMLRLGDAVSATGRIGPVLADRVVATVRRLRQVALGAGADDVIAKATSAIRTAADGSDVLDRIESEAGQYVEVISGLEEARLIFLAIRSSVVLEPPPALCFDLGGGSVEIMVGDRRGLRWATSEPLGVGRLTAEFVRDDPIRKPARRALEDHLRSALAPAAAAAAEHAPAMAVGSSGTLGDLAAVAVELARGKRPTSRNGLTVSRDEFRDLHRRIVRSTVDERRALPGLEEKRAELIVAGSTFLDIAFEVFGFASLTISDWALREGIILDEVGNHDDADWSDDPRALRAAAVANLARRCRSDVTHTAQVARLALTLFDRTQALHGLGEPDRELLEYAARLHDIGQHVSRKAHHKHAGYLVRHGELRGFGPDEIQLLAALVRHGRRGEPKSSEELLGALEPGERDRVRRLAAVLRLADGLDRGRDGVVRDVEVQISEDLVLLRLHVRGDPELVMWGVRRRRDLFEQEFGRELEVVVGSGTPERVGVAAEV